MLPDINGFEICRRLKSKRETNAIPVVLVTARLAADGGLEGGAREPVERCRSRIPPT